MLPDLFTSLTPRPVGGGVMPVCGLRGAAHHNGKTGVVAGAAVDESGRLLVALEDGGSLSIKPENLRPADPGAAAADGAATGGGEPGGGEQAPTAEPPHAPTRAAALLPRCRRLTRALASPVAGWAGE